jgi:PKD repeat protein
LTWDFGDKTITEAAGGIHVYENPGKYEIVLKVEDECGNVKSFRKWIEIKPAKVLQAKK